MRQFDGVRVMAKQRAFCCDYRELLPRVARLKRRTLVLADPPYGISLNTDFNCKNVNSSTHRRIVNDHEPFDPSPLLGFRHVILFGANNYASRLPDSGSWIVWDKVTRNDLGVRIAECELAWTSFLKRTRCYRHMWSGAFRDSERGTKLHPTQKPVSLMWWCIKLLRDVELVFDPFCGSGPVAVACAKLGIEYVGCDVDAQYIDITNKRLRRAQAEKTFTSEGLE